MNLNETFFQSFHWYYPADGSLWNHIAQEAENLQKLGITYVWLPPAYKAREGPQGVGYGVYDLYDLGEFNQKGDVRTKYGTKEEYLHCIETLHQKNIKVVVDIVLNHREGGDEIEKILVEDQDPDNRNAKVGEPYEREVQSKFTFPGRQGKYSSFIWDFHCFTGINDKDDIENKRKFYKIKNEYGEGWEEVMGKEFGNFDYLLGADVEFRNPAVREELKRWVEWYYDITKFDGIRLDAIKHMNTAYIIEWVEHLRQKAGKEIFAVAEFWSQKVDDLMSYISASQGKIQLYDVPLHYNFHAASRGEFDMRKILDNTLMQRCPECCISFVENHDTQPLQALESTVDFWFIPLGYAIILLRKQGMPSVFYSSVFGASYCDKGKDGNMHEVKLEPIPCLSEMLSARKDIAYGEQRDYFDHPNTIGWVREGVDEKPDSGCAVVITNGGEGYKDMEIGKKHSGTTFIDLLKNRNDEVNINQDGWGKFPVNERSVSVWVKKK
jgi:alpha-amylase